MRKMLQKVPRPPHYTHQLHPHIPEPFADINDKVADKISRYFGSMTMFWVLVGWQLTWIIVATLNFWIFKFDRYPFPFLLFLSNLIQLWALPVLGATQNRADAKRTSKAATDHRIFVYLAQRIDGLYEVMGSVARAVTAEDTRAIENMIAEGGPIDQVDGDE